MSKKPPTSTAAAKRRPWAAATRRERPGAQTAEDKAASTEAETAREFQELQVHQFELEMQNAELQAARDELEAALEKYTDLYDFAPVGYLTLDRDGIIREANLAGANLLGIARSALLNRRFGSFVSAAELPAFGLFLQRVFAGKVRQEHF